MIRPDFLGGVVEGFYGQVWSHAQRLHLLEQMVSFGLNTYFYAPKNDLKHRAIWRDSYTDSEMAQFSDLVAACARRGLNFIYGLSPGLDIRFSERAERNRLKSRFDQLRRIGVRHFALLFDDLPGGISDDDRGAYESLAAAHCDVANAIFAWIRGHSTDARFLFCPTPYCDRMDHAQLGGAKYLDEVGRLLSPEIDVLWTGPEVISFEIPIESIERLSRRLGRPPLIWDNLFANDYDLRRLYCGPYSGRPRELRRAVRGILINPNNEFPINFIALRTVGDFLNGDGEWKPREDFLSAAAEWRPCFETVTEPWALADLILLADCFYLPHEEGPEAQRLLGLVDHLLATPVERWHGGYEQFCDMNARVQTVFDRLTEMRDRELFAAWSRRAWQLKEELLTVSEALAQKATGHDITKGIKVEGCLPGTFRGGILAQLERRMSMDAHGKFRPRTTA
jgi:protein O-GlcNAcase/histone acetyltransferase